MRLPGLHPQLETDCHTLGIASSGLILVHRNSALPWFILVPRSEAENLLALPEDLLHSLLADARVLSEFIVHDLDHPRVNVASIGNLVPQLHLHVVGRRPGDVCWPRPVWGNLGDPVPYAAADVDRLRQGLLARGVLRDIGG